MRPRPGALLPLLVAACLFRDEPGALELDGPRRVRVGASVGPFVVADLDADGRSDIALVGVESGTATVLWGGPEGGHESVRTYPLGQGPQDILAADLDADGRLDLAAPLADEGAVAVLSGRGDRDFAPARRHPCGARPRLLAAADLDADGRLDLVAADDEELHVLRGAAGGFTPAGATRLGPGLGALAVGDFTGDGAPEVVAGLADAGEVHLLAWTGPEGLAPRDVLYAGGAPSALVTADLDDDGALDLGVADGLLDEAVVLFGDGAGGVREERRWTLPPAPASLVVRRGAGGPELVVGTRDLLAQIDPRSDAPARLTMPPLTVHALAAGSPGPDGEEPLLLLDIVGRLHPLAPAEGPTFVPVWRDPFPEPLKALDVVDVDGDGRLDLVAVDRDGDRMLVFPGEDELRFGEPRTYTEFAPFDALRLADMDADGRVDVVRLLQRQGEAPQLDLLLQQAEGGFASVVTRPIAYSQEFILADLDADDAPEVLVESSGAVAVYRLDPALPSPPAEPDERWLEGVNFRDWSVLDLDGDTDLDLAALESGYPTSSLATYARAGGDMVPVFRGPLPALQWQPRLSFAELDGDGRPDALLCDSTLALAPGVGPLSFGTFREISEVQCGEVAAADLDGDPYRDLVVMRFWTGAGSIIEFGPAGVEVLRGLAPQPEGPVFARGGATAAPGQLAGLVLADLDADARPDVWVGSDRGASVLRASEGPILVPQEELGLVNSATVALAELDGDGRSDLLVPGHFDLVGVARQDARGEFEPTRFHDLSRLGAERVLAARPADVDGDAIDEVLALVSTDEDGSAMALLTLDAREGLELRRSLALPGSRALALQVLDADEDGRDDVLIATDTDPELRLLPGAAELPAAGLDIWAPSSLVTTDFDRDGHLDLTVLPSGLPSWPVLELFRGDGRGGFHAHRRWELQIFNLFSWSFGDLDGDGRDELIYRSYYLTLHRCPLAEDLSLGACRPLGLEALAMAVLDFDGDGVDDLVTVNEDAEGPYLLVARVGADGRLIPRRAPLPEARGGTLRRAVLDPAIGPELVALDPGGMTRITALD